MIWVRSFVFNVAFYSLTFVWCLALTWTLLLKTRHRMMAGEGFFGRLERILADPKRVEALTVYHMALQFGFEGRYAVRGGELELDFIRRRVREGLGRLLKKEPVSRRHMPAREPLRSRSMDFLVLWLGLFALLFAFCFLIVLRVSLDGMTEDLDTRGKAILKQFAGSAQSSPSEAE